MNKTQSATNMMSPTRIDAVIVGLGRTGLSVARHLARQGRRFGIVDTRSEPPGLAEFQRTLNAEFVRLGGLSREDLLPGRSVVVSPGFPLAHPEIEAARAAGAKISGDIELFAKANRVPVIAITGTNGKSTVTTLVGEMLRTSGVSVGVGGNLDTPALDLIAWSLPNWIVLELSSYQLETVETLTPEVAVVLNISPDHLDRYPSLQAYVRAKQRIYEHARCRVANLDDPQVMAMLEGHEYSGFTLNEPSREMDFGIRLIDGERWIVRGFVKVLPVNRLLLPGRHNLANVLAALALGVAAGFSIEAIQEAAITFRGLPHRCQWVGEKQGVQWYDDSKGTNVGATLAAIEGLGGPLVLIAGGQGKGQNFAPLRDPVRTHARMVIVLGEAAAEIERALGDVVLVKWALDMVEAVGLASRFTQPGDRVLLSPACASLDMFPNFATRGDAFVRAFREEGA